MTKQTLHGPNGFHIVLDSDEIFPDDPGNGTPAMVYANAGKWNSTYWCAEDTGEMTVSGSVFDTVDIPQRALDWLRSEKIMDAVNDFIEKHS